VQIKESMQIMTIDSLDTSDRRNFDWQRLWAKTDQNTGHSHYHPLLCHMLDVAAVAGLVWDHHLTSELRNRLACAFGVVDARSLVVFATGAHDIGKACPGFQKKVAQLCQYAELPVSNNDQDRPHGFISAHALNEFLGSCHASALLGQIVGGHHGVFPRSAELQMGCDALGNKAWKTARHELLKELASIVGLDLKQVLQSKAEITDPFAVAEFAGFVSVADWIGSNQDFFPCAAECGKKINSDAVDYWKPAQSCAQRALDKLGWLPAVTFAEEARFDEIFHGFTPNALQIGRAHV
jgi:CRISPR-associated endonuclease/helicase Cas3